MCLWGWFVVLIWCFTLYLRSEWHFKGLDHFLWHYYVDFIVDNFHLYSSTVIFPEAIASQLIQVCRWCNLFNSPIELCIFPGFYKLLTFHVPILYNSDDLHNLPRDFCSFVPLKSNPYFGPFYLSNIIMIFLRILSID